MNATPNEVWLPVVGWEDAYEVSNCGQVRSVDRTIVRKDRWGQERPLRLRGKLLSPRPDHGGRVRVNLSRGGTVSDSKIHQLVLAAFVGLRPGGMVSLHWDDDPTNNHLSNLRYGTESENSYDKVRNGNHPMAKKTHCKRNHEFTQENTIVRRDGFRACRACYREKHREVMRAKRAADRIAIEKTETG